DAAFVAEPEAFLARRQEREDYSAIFLQDLTVNTVYESGLGASLRQVAVQLLNDEGARDYRTYSISFDPGSQRLEILRARIFRGTQVLEASESFEQQLGEPWYRIYYDTRARVLVFSDLQAGDVLELQWRIDDVSHQNLFADYYGDLTFLQEYAPIRHEEYVLLSPVSRTFHFNEPNLPGLQRRTEVQGDTRVTRFFAEDVPALQTEQNMPGMTEVAPYLHVSTYESWEGVGRWYWGLIQDQVRLDDELRATVAQLTRRLRTDRQKVEAIHNWVLDNTRYVGLEFGIHGYKPYRVTQIARRGFGDCKDKASLMFAMFREAGVDAHIVLTRTRRNGRIEDLPASLAIFDHAIAYVPSLDLYIDGTAEHNGLRELPTMDQGVTVLHVWPEGSELRRTPVLEADISRRARSLDVRLDADGSAELEGRETVLGGEAPAYRARFAADGTRQARFERALRSTFPGISLRTQRFEGLDDRNAEVRVRYEGRAPNFAERGADTLRVPLTTLSELTRAMATRAERRHALDLGSTSAYAEVRTIVPPRGMQVAAVPSDGVAESPFGRVAIEVQRRGENVRVLTRFELRTDRVAQTDYAAFRAWTLAADELLRQQVVVAR
ncbi:MAG: DUF3857 and transglutaminase domain-containing protein, partial [Myxococcota bacterium]